MRTLRLSSIALVLACAACQKAPEKPAPEPAVVQSAAPVGPPLPPPADQTALVEKVTGAEPEAVTILPSTSARGLST